MPERENPQTSSQNLSDELFANLPEPSHKVPSVNATPPVPGSRRARREATTQDGAPQAAQSQPQPVESAAVLTEPEAAMPRTAAEPSRPTLDDLLATESEPRHSGPAKKKRRVGCIIALVILLAVIGGIVTGGAWVMNTYREQINALFGWGEPADWEPGQATGEALVTIREGDTGAPVSTALFEAGVTKTDGVFYDYLVQENIAVTFYPGVYKLQQKMTAADALEALNNPASKAENTTSVPEGATIESFLPAIAESMDIPLDKLQAAVQDPSAYGVEADSLEGWLFPAIYTFDPDATATEVIQRMVDRTRESLAEAGVPDGEEQRILTIASIIQREGRTDDFPKVSRVIENRLAPNNTETQGMLQMDSTAQYGVGELHEGSAGSSEKALKDPNPWNTYVHPGLPKGPIATASDAAIDAAMHPADGPWFYFVTVNLNTGETVFSATYAEQKQAEKQLHEWCASNPDAGCYAE